jgi:hypothetical protein
MAPVTKFVSAPPVKMKRALRFHVNVTRGNRYLHTFVKIPQSLLKSLVNANSIKEKLKDFETVRMMQR